jgi:hypothetical protein
MTARGAIVLFLFGALLLIIGGLFKIQHWPYAGGQLMAGTLFQAIAVIVFAIKVSRYPGLKDFLDR